MTNTMQNSILTITKIIYLLFYISGSFANNVTTCKYLFTTTGKATQNLSALLESTNAPIVSNNVTAINTSAEVKKWRHHPGLERWELQLPRYLNNTKANIIDICENKLGMGNTILPKKVNYSGVLFLGAILSRVIERADFYNFLIQKGFIDSHLKIWVLTGTRKLNARAGETKDNFLKLAPPTQKPLPIPTNEQEMIKYVFYYKMPKNINVEYIYSDKEIGHTRATTSSTTYAWLKKIPEATYKTYYIAISNQPYVIYTRVSH